jgi:hypothetical protein
MPPCGPISRSDLVRALRRVGYTGPFPGGKHSFMLREGHRPIMPNPHCGIVSVQLLAQILRKAELTHQDWEAL